MSRIGPQRRSGRDTAADDRREPGYRAAGVTRRSVAPVGHCGHVLVSDFGWFALVGVLGGCARGATNLVRCAPSPWVSSPPLVIAQGGGEGLGPSNTIEAMSVRSSWGPASSTSICG